MIIYTKQNVYEAALDRIRWLYDEFPNIVVNMSGGKDSTVIFNLTHQVATEKNRLPVRVLFIDQEAEWQSTIDYMRSVMYRPDVDPLKSIIVKDFYDLIEKALERCREAAAVIAHILLKNS